MVQNTLARTPLYSLHKTLGAKFTAFAGYDMPVQYPAGIIAEHRHTREAASLFDVSHMGQLLLEGAGGAAALERLVPSDIAGLRPGRMRYTVLTNESGGILDDLMVAKTATGLRLVVNAATKATDLAHLRDRLGTIAVTPLEDQALLAVQGPAAATVLDRLSPGIAALGFMTTATIEIAGIACFVSRSGYTGEDGFEISVPAEKAEALAERLLAQNEVAPAGLGARDTLRLEAGLCLYGADIDETTTPVEADLAWVIPARRRQEGGFPGAATILRQLADGPKRRRIGLRPEGRQIARAGTAIIDSAGTPIGTTTSGGFSPSLEAPIAMGYIASAQSALGNTVGLSLRGTAQPARIAALPFVPHRYHSSR